MEDGKAVALPRGPEHRPNAATGREGQSNSIYFSLLVCGVAPCNMKKAGPQGPAGIEW